jgi:hypothetical protein
MMGKPNRERRFRTIAQALLQALAFKHLPSNTQTQPSPLREGAVTSRGSPEGIRKYLCVIHHA